jgi:formyltetrahydrofolate-dependent phosphoribosylglycinamide formyltransferase
MVKSPVHLAVLVSGSGTTLQNFIDVINAKKLDATIELVIGSRAGIGGIERARRANLHTEIVERKKFVDVAAFSERVFELIDASNVDLVCLAGWLCLLEIPRRWENRMMNIHPALLPNFGGKGMYGKHVHETVLAHGEKVSGCTVHFVDGTYDSGPIVLQRTCAVMDSDTPETLAARVFEEEKIAYPRAIELFARAKLRIDGRGVRIAQ